MGLPPYMVGTRNPPTQSLASNTVSSSVTQSLTRDKGMSKNITAACTFVNGATKQVQGANGLFAAFVVGDEVLIQGTSLNDGVFRVMAIDGVNQAFLTLNPSPKNESPLTATIRTA
jgi:hypothetical protein